METPLQEPPDAESQGDFGQWQEAEEAGDERLPFAPHEMDADPIPPVEDPAGAEPDDDESPDTPRQPAEPEYPKAPCYVTVGQGDCVLSLAQRYRRLPTQIWEAPENSELSKKRKRNVLLPGDRVYIPTLEPKEVDAASEKRHRFVLHRATCVLKLKLLRQGKPRSNMHYRLQVEDEVHDGRTDGSGMLEVRIPADAREGTLVLPDEPKPESYPVYLGHLNPVEDTAGVQARLNNLGFACGKADGKVGPHTQAALAAFQRANRLQVTGRIDDPTRQKLLELHGS